MSDETRRLDYVHFGSDPPNVETYLAWKYEGDAGESRRTFETWDEARDAYNAMVEHAYTYGVVPAVPSSMWNKITPLPIPAPGHGQGTEEERVERAARWIAADRHEGVNFWEHTDANGYSPLEKHAYREKARAILAAADAVPGPEVEWTSEDGRSNSSDLYLRIVADVADCIRSIRVGDDPISEARTIVSRIAHEWKLVPVPISEPPVTKGEG